jgi:glycosyltransferase involved in cell wall biosynthesis
MTHGIANALDTIIETARLLQDRGASNIHFLLVGQGPEKQRLTETAQKWGLNNVTFFKSVPKKAVPGLLTIVDIAVLAYKKLDQYTKYGISTNKLWEYMMCATPVVLATNSTFNPVDDSHCGITVPAEDPEKMAQAFANLTSLSAKDRQLIGMRGQEYIQKYHLVPLLAERLLEVLQTV